MTTFVCRNCGAEDFEIVEMTPRQREIRVVAAAHGGPEAIDDIDDASDELFYEASEFSGYMCTGCSMKAPDIAELVTARAGTA